MIYRFTLNNSIFGTEVLAGEPKGWDDAQVIIERGKKYHGIILNYSIKVDFFHGSGKEFIDNVYETQGEEATINIYIDIDFNGSGNYQRFFTGVLDLSTYDTYGDVGQRDSFTQVNIINNSFTQTVLNRINTKVDFTKLTTLNGTVVPALTYGPYDLTLHSKAIRYSTLFENDDNIGVMQEFTPTYGQNSIITDIYFDAPFQIQYSEFGEYQEPVAPYHPNGQFIFEADTTDDLIIDYDVAVDFIEGCDSLSRSFSIQLGLRVGATTYTLDGPNSFGPTTVNPINVSYSAAGTQLVTGITPGTQIYLYVNIANYTLGSGPPATSVCRFKHTWGEGFIKISKDTTTAATTAKAFAIHEAGAQIARVITDQADAFRSNFFGRKNSEPVSYSSNGCGAFTALTNGFQIRKFPLAERPVYMSMDDYFEGLNAIYNLGMGIEEVNGNFYVRVEPKEYFYSTGVLMQLPNIPDLRKRFSKDYIYNGMEIGYTKWTAEELNGLDEFNTKREYTLNKKTTNQKLTAVSNLVAGGYPLEFARRLLYLDVPTTDYDYDKDNFIICLNRSVDGSGNPNNLDEAEKNENFIDPVINLISPETAYNLRISPGRNLLRWNNILSSGLLKIPGSEIQFSYGEGNYLLQSAFVSDTCTGNYNNEYFAENQNIVWDSNKVNNASLWIPEVFEFSYPLSFADFQNINSIGSDGKLNSYKAIEISRTETDFIKCYILKIVYTPTKGLAEFTLLRAND